MTASSLFYTAQRPFQAAREWPDGCLHGHGFLARVAVPARGCSSAFPGDEPGRLASALSQALSPLDYSLVNRRVEAPSDARLARWLLDRLEGCDDALLGLSGHPDHGVLVGHGNPDRAWTRFRFEAAHRLPNVPEGHKCGRMHGHGFEVVLDVELSDPEEEPRMAQWRLAAARKLHDQLHHACLNDLPGLENPTSEVLAAWIWQRLRPEQAALRAVSVMETASAGCQYDGEHWRIWKSMSFDSAVRLRRAPRDDARGGLHGHTFETRLHLVGGLDEVLGWVADYGDVKRRFDPLFRRLDHQPLHEAAWLEDNDAATIARFIEGEMRPTLPGLGRIDVLETPGCGALLLRDNAASTGLMQP